MIDWKRVGELRDDFGEEDFLEIVEMFLTEVEAKLEGLPQQPFDALAEDFHFLKGSAANLGFRAFQALCSDCEKSPNPAEIPKVLQTFNVSKEAFLEGVNSESKAA